MRCFFWLGPREIAADVDLRRCGWRLRAAMPVADSTGVLPIDCPILLDRMTIDPRYWRWLMAGHAVLVRRWVLVLGIGDGDERARLLRKGFGDVVSREMLLAEVQARALRILANADALHRWREYGPLRLDLIQREAFAHKQALGLHPREFAVLWRLMESPGTPVQKHELLRDVWRLTHAPETNSLAVHASRLRAKLTMAGLPGWIQTVPAGGYQLTPAGEPDWPDPACRVNVQPD